MSSLHFLDAPVIQQEQTNIKTVAGEEIHITCTVEAEPAPALTWHRDGQEVTDRDQGVVINQAGNRYNLIILGTQHYLLLISHYLYDHLRTLPLQLNECLRVHIHLTEMKHFK